MFDHPKIKVSELCKLESEQEQKKKMAEDFKKDWDRGLSCKRIEIRKYKILFQIEDLLAQRNFFQTYIKLYGPKPPVDTEIATLNWLGNGLLSYSHYIRTNQSYAKQILTIIDEAKIDNNGKIHEAVAVNNALVKIKTVHDLMINKGINGEVIKKIKLILKKFDCDLNPAKFQAQQEKIVEVLKEIDTIYAENKRMPSPRYLKG